MSHNNRKAWDQIAQRPAMQGQHSKGTAEKKQQQNKPEKKPNFFVYNARVAWRFYAKLAQEFLLAFMLVLPVWLYFKWMKISVVEVPTDLPVLLGIAFVAFLLQSFMFMKGN